jgi:tetratricopeptide (TPR) repeat protein
MQMTGLAYDNNAYYQEDYDRAIAETTEMIRIDPSQPGPYYWRAQPYDQKGDFDRAIIDYNEALRIDPNSALLHFGRGMAYDAKPEPKKALVPWIIIEFVHPRR